jgi:hypothetical protein
MTLADFQRHLTKYNCSHTPNEGGNLTGIGIRVKNNTNNQVFHLQLYRGGEVSDSTILLCCDRLGVPYPPHLDELMDEEGD